MRKGCDVALRRIIVWMKTDVELEKADDHGRGRWMEDFEDLKRMDVRSWKEMATCRDDRRLLREAKTQQSL